MDTSLDLIPSQDDMKIDLMELEMQQRAFTLELSMKRDQVDQLRNDLDAAHYKIHELTQSYESLKMSKEELEFHFNISIKNTRSLEEKVNSNKDTVIKSRMRQDSLAFENQVLKDLLSKAELENHRKTKIIEEMETQNHCHSIYQKDIIEQNNKLRSFLDKCQDLLKKVIEKQTVVLEQNKVTELNKALQETVNYYKKANTKLKKNNIDLENKLIKAESLWMTYKDMLNEMDLFSGRDESNMLLDELIKAKDKFKNEINSKEDTINMLKENLDKEKDLNIKLWDTISKLEKENEEMKLKLNATKLDKETMIDFFN